MWFEASAPATVAVDCEGVPDGLDLVQVAIRADAGPTVLVFDCVKLTPHRVCECLRDILISPAVTVLFHDVHKDAYALAIHGGVPVLHGVQHPQWHPNTRPWTDIHAICTPACLFPPRLLAACRNSRKSSREKHANRARKALDAVRAAPANRKKRFFRDIFAKCESLILSRFPILVVPSPQ